MSNYLGRSMHMFAAKCHTTQWSSSITSSATENPLLRPQNLGDIWLQCRIPVVASRVYHGIEVFGAQGHR